MRRRCLLVHCKLAELSTLLHIRICVLIHKIEFIKKIRSVV
uniref:Uncharacterized protein n=1 Tax=Anguilla anguilla TaxID=7936 RepID=A0A0E9T756_ANGAN